MLGDGEMVLRSPKNGWMALWETDETCAKSVPHCLLGKDPTRDLASRLHPLKMGEKKSFSQLTARRLVSSAPHDPPA